MRTKTGKDLKKGTENDLKISLSVPKVVLDASDCAKLLDGTGKTSVVLVERDGKMVPASSSSVTSSSSFTSSSDTLLSLPVSTSFSLSSKSKSTVTVSSSLEAMPIKSPKSFNDSLASTSHALNKIPSSTSNGGQKAEVADHNESLSNYVQDSVPLDQGKMILKPPKKRRVNDTGLYDDSTTSSLLNGETSHSVITTAVPTVPFVGEAKEAVALRSTPSFPVISAPSTNNSLQKHTIENLLQVSSQPSLNNNNNSNSSNMNLISGPPYSHQTYNPIHPSSIHDLCSPTTIPPLPTPALPALSSASSLSHHLSVLSSSASLSSSHNNTTSSVPLKMSHEPMLHSDTDPSIMFSYSNKDHPLQIRQVHSHVPAILSSGSENVIPSIPNLSSSQPSSPPGSQQSFRTSPEQNEPINLSTSSKPDDKSILAHPISKLTNDHDSVGDQTISECGSKNHLIEPNLHDMGKIPKVVQNTSEMSYSETNGINHLAEKSFLNKKIEKDSKIDGLEEGNETNSSQKNILECKMSKDCPNNLISEKLDICSPHSVSHTSPSVSQCVPMESEDQDVEMQVETEREQIDMNMSNDVSSANRGEKSSLEKPLYLSENCEDSSKTVAEVEGQRPSAKPLSNLTCSENLSLQAPSSAKKSKKHSKKKVEIPMDEESCAIRSSSYSESIDHVIHHFEYVNKPVDEICLTEEEEAILREQFDDDSGVNSCSHDKDSGKKDLNLNSLPQTKEESVSGSDKTNSQPFKEEIKSKSKVSRKKESKKQCKEKLSPSMQNVMDILTFVAADITNDISPTESGLLDLEAMLKSLNSKCEKKLAQFGGENGSSHENVDAKMILVLKKAKKTLSDISLFYPSSVVCESQQLEEDSMFKDMAPQAISAAGEEVKIQLSKKPVKRKSNSRESLVFDKANCNSEIDSTSGSVEDTLKPKKAKKAKDSSSKIKKARRPTAIVAISNQSSSSGNDVVQLSGECPSQSGFKLDTSDIGESIASISGGSDEQMTPVHEPDTKDEAVNTDQLMDHDTGLESNTEDKDNKPVRHYKKRLDFVKCLQCDHQCRGRSALSRHMKKVHLLEADMPYKCHLCTYGCTKMASLNRHLYTHSVFPCSRCDFRTDERDKLTEHMAERHKDKLDMKLCKVCSRYIKCEGFTIEEHTNDCQGPTPFKCTECSKEFKYASSLRVHHHTHFPDEPKLFKCELCDYRTNYKANLHKHHKNMHAVKDRLIQCPDCDKYFSTEDNMRRHRKVHTLVRQFACETCKKTFKTSGALKGHQLIHTATRPFTCNIPGCNRSFRTAKFLKSHQEEFHRLVPKKFFCQVEGCNYSFFKRSHLKRHAITHTGERNYHCAWPGCRKSFRHADNLKVHFRGHSNEKTVQCHLCDFKCKLRDSLIKHKKKIHKIFDAASIATTKRTEDDPKSKVEGNVAVSMKGENSEINTDNLKNEEGGEDKSCGRSDDNDTGKVEFSDTPKMSTSMVTVCVPKISSGPMDLYEFKSDDESEEEGPSPLRWEGVKSVPATPLPPPPKELLLKNERLEKKERDKLERAEKKEQLKKEKADKKELEKKEKAEKKNQEKKEKAEKKELEKKEREEKKELEKREKMELKEKEKKGKEEQKEKEKKEKEEQREKEKKEKEEQKEREKKEKEEQKETEKLKRKEEKEKEKTEKLAQKEKERREKERKNIEVKRLKHEAKKMLQKRSARAVKGITRKTASLISLKSKSAKGKKSLISTRRKSPVRTAASKRDVVDEKKLVKNRKKQPESIENVTTKGKSLAARKMRERANNNKSPIVDNQEKPPSRSASPRSASPRAASPRAASPRGGISKSPENKKASSKGKKKAASLPRRKPSARIKASQKSQKIKKSPAAAMKKPNKGATKKAKPVKKGRPFKKKVPESDVENDDDEEDIVDDSVDNTDCTDKAIIEEESKTEVVSANVDVESKESSVKEKTSQEKKTPSRAPSPSSSEEDMLQGKASPYRDFSDAEDLEKDEKDEAEKMQSSLESFQDEENSGPVQSSSETPKDVQENEDDPPYSRKAEEEDDEFSENAETYHGDASSDDEDINDIPLTPPRAPAPPPMESSEDELEPDTIDQSAPYSSTPAPNTPFSVPAPTTPFSVPAPNTPFSVPGPTTPFSVPPPTNLVQQHSVHSEEMTTGVSSVASLDMPSTGSVEMQQPLESVESHPIGSVEMHPRNSTETHHHNNSVEMHHRNSTEMHPHGSVEMHPHGSVEMHPHGSVEMHPHGSVEMHPHGSVEMHPRGSVEMHPHGSVEIHPHGSVEMHPHGSVEMHPRGSVEMHPHGSVEMHPQGSVEIHPQGSVEMHHRNSTEMHPHTSVEIPAPHDLIEMHHTAVTSEMHAVHNRNIEMHAHSNTLERSQSHAPENVHQVPQSSLSQAESISSTSSEMAGSSTLPTHDKFNMPSAVTAMDENESNTSEADKRYFDQYLKNLSAANNQEAARRNSSNHLMGSPSESRDIMNKSPSAVNNPLQSAVPTSVITTMDSTSTLFPGQADLRRLEAMVGERQHPDSLYGRDAISALSRPGTATPLLPTNHATPTPTFDAFPSLNPLHSSSAAAAAVVARDNASSYLRPQENIFATPPVTSSFMAEAMFQRQSMTTPFLPPPQPTDRNSLSRISDPTASLRTNNTSSLLRRPSTMPGTDMFTAPTVPQTVPRHPLTNAWSGQEVRPTHWQTPYLPRQSNMAAAANNPFFPAKENYLGGREFMFDPSAVRSPTERGMFSSLASSQSQDSLQFDRFDLSNFFPGAVAPYGSSASSLDYSRTSHCATPKPFDERYRQTAAAAALPDFRGLPTPTSAAADRFPGIGVNSGFNLYPSNHTMPYHPQHVTDNVNSAFLTHPSTAQHAMLERDYAAAAAHRGLYGHHHPHQNTPYHFIDDRQYSAGSSKLGHHSHHTTATTVAQERDLMSRSTAQDSQMQDPYRSMLYRY